MSKNIEAPETKSKLSKSKNAAELVALKFTSIL